VLGLAFLFLMEGVVFYVGIYVVVFQVLVVFVRAISGISRYCFWKCSIQVFVLIKMRNECGGIGWFLMDGIVYTKYFFATA
jgi:hypothetical protein